MCFSFSDSGGIPPSSRSSHTCPPIRQTVVSHQPILRPSHLSDWQKASVSEGLRMDYLSSLRRHRTKRKGNRTRPFHIHELLSKAHWPKHPIWPHPPLLFFWRCRHRKAVPFHPWLFSTNRKQVSIFWPPLQNPHCRKGFRTRTRRGSVPPKA